MLQKDNANDESLTLFFEKKKQQQQQTFEICIVPFFS